MRDRRRPSDQVNHDRWLVSYADFVTLLFAFFVVLYASAQIDKKKAESLSGAIESGFQELGIFPKDAGPSGSAPHRVPLPGDGKNEGDPARNLSRLASSSLGLQEVSRKKEDFDALRMELEKALAAEIKRNEVALRLDPDGLVVSLREVGFFDSGSAVLKPGAESAFSRVASILQAHSCAVRIEGHTDTVPIHTLQYASNWELSTARATELVKSLIEDHGVSADRLSAAGYAEFHPIASNDSAKGRQLNRRVDLVILAAPGRTPMVKPRLPNDGPKTPGQAAAAGKAIKEPLGGKAG
jgi:chemotaxis protein MotB